MSDPTPNNGGCLEWLMAILMALLLPAAVVGTPPTPEVRTVSTLEVVFAVEDGDAAALARDVLDARLRQLGVPSHSIEIGEDTLVVRFELGGLEAQTIIAALSAPGLLELVRMENLDSATLDTLRGQVIQTTGRAALLADAAADGLVNPLTGQPFETLLSNGDAAPFITFASAVPQAAGWSVTVTFSEAAGARLGAYTEANIGQPLAIVLDGRALSIPTIQARIEASAVIAGTFTEAEARTLAAQIVSVPLPVELRVLSVNVLE